MFNWCVSCFLAFAVAWSQSPAAAGTGQDLLDMPALTSDKATKALLTGVGRAGQRLVAVGERGIIIYSDDDGNSWTQAKVPVSVTLTAVYFPTAKDGWAVGHDGVILNTGDAGTTWKKQFDGNLANSQVVAEKDRQYQLAKAALESASGTAKDMASEVATKAADALADAKAGAKFGPSRPLLDVWFRNAHEGFVVGSYGLIFHTSDGGRNWAYVGSGLDNPEGLHYNAIRQMPGGSLVIAGEGGRLYRSGDGGTHWEVWQSDSRAPFYGVLGLRASDGRDVLLAFGFAGRIYRSVDDGKHWEQVTCNCHKTFVGGVVLDDREVVLIDADGRVVRSRNLGQSFTPTSTGLGTTLSGMGISSNGNLIVTGAGGVRAMSLHGEGK